MKQLFEDLLIHTAIYTRILRRLGFSMITLVSVWDLIFKGLGQYRLFSISYLGILVIWAGVAMIYLAGRAEKHMR